MNYIAQRFLLSGVHRIVRPPQQLIEVAGLLHTAGVAAYRRKVGGRLAIKKSQFAQFISPQGMQSVLPDVSEEGLKPSPVSLSLFQPGNGDHSKSLVICDYHRLQIS